MIQPASFVPRLTFSDFVYLAFSPVMYKNSRGRSEKSDKAEVVSLPETNVHEGPFSLEGAAKRIQVVRQEQICWLFGRAF